MWVYSTTTFEKFMLGPRSRLRSWRRSAPQSENPLERPLIQPMQATKSFMFQRISRLESENGFPGTGPARAPNHALWRTAAKSWWSQRSPTLTPSGRSIGISTAWSSTRRGPSSCSVTPLSSSPCGSSSARCSSFPEQVITPLNINFNETYFHAFAIPHWN